MSEADAKKQLKQMLGAYEMWTRSGHPLPVLPADMEALRVLMASLDAKRSKP